MKIKTVSSLAEFQSGLQSNPRAFLFLYKKGSEQSDCAFERIKNIEKESEHVLFAADVNDARDIHPFYGIKSAPSLIEFDHGTIKNIYKGCQTETFYTDAISGTGFSNFAAAEGKKSKRVLVYTTPTCSWCNTIKTYLNENGIRFTEVDVASNPGKAEEMVRKSGKQGVPQTDIDGHIVVGFDRKRINELLEIN